MNDFFFSRPWLLLLLPLAALLYWLFYTRLSPKSNWENLIDQRLQPFVLLYGKSSRRIQILCASLMAVALISLAGPAYQGGEGPAFRNSDALVVLLNLSNEMNSNDVAPSRLHLARFKLQDLLKERKDGYTALVLFAGDAFMLSPLTHDINTIRNHVPNITTDWMPINGSNLQSAVDLGAELLQSSGLVGGALLAISHTSDQNIIDSQYPLYILGVGSNAGGPVPSANGTYQTDMNGAIKISRLEEGNLTTIATQNNGEFVRMSIDDSDLTRIAQKLEQSAKAFVRSDERFRTLTAKPLGPWLVLILIAAALISSRRGQLP